MEIALIISLIALAVALPGCIADSLIVIEKIRAHRTKRLLKKSSKSSLDYLSLSLLDSDHIHPLSLNRYARLRSTVAHEIAHTALQGALKKI